MSDTKISAMTTATTLTGGEIVPLVQSGANVQQTVSNTLKQGLAATELTTLKTDQLILPGLTGYLYGNNTSAVTASTTIPYSAITGTPSLKYGAFHQDGNTTLSTPISASGAVTTIAVAATTGFPATGWVWIDNEVFSYTGKTVSSFTGCTRAQLGTTSAAHSAGVGVSEVQGTGSATAIGAVSITGTDFSSGISIDGTDITKLVFSVAGIYNVQISAQLVNYDNAQDNITLWFAQNGTNITSSASIVTIPARKNTNIPGAALLALNIYVQTSTTNEYVQIKWTTDNGNSMIATYPSSAVAPVHPSSPAVILTAQQVA